MKINLKSSRNRVTAKHAEAQAGLLRPPHLSASTSFALHWFHVAERGQECFLGGRFYAFFIVRHFLVGPLFREREWGQARAGSRRKQQLFQQVYSVVLCDMVASSGGMCSWG